MPPLKHKRICLIPLDARPVCYDLPRRLALAAGFQPDMPSPKLLSCLKAPADFKAMKRWLKNHLFENAPVIAALDTLAYGGLIPSRVGSESLKVLQDRISEFFKVVKAPSIYGFSSIMRIPDYDFAEEEPDYWAEYGRLLHQYSAETHRHGEASEDARRRIPPGVLADFLGRRQRNLSLNRSYIERLADAELDYLVFCQDDTGEYGLNVQEGAELEALLRKQKLASQAHLQTGADEVAASLFARWLATSLGAIPKIHVRYSDEEGRKLIARFDGQPIESVVDKHIRACGAVPAKKAAEADLILLVHTPHRRQGDHCEAITARTRPEQVDEVIRILQDGQADGEKIMLADVAYANGSDPALTERLLCTFDDITGLYGYAGWNTPGNTLGTALAMGVVRLLSEEQGRFSSEEFNRLMMIRFGDDWLYQADVRYTIRQSANGKPPDETLLNLTMATGLELIQSRLGLEGSAVSCRFPCQRSFEVEITVK